MNRFSLVLSDQASDILQFQPFMDHNTKKAGPQKIRLKNCRAPILELVPPGGTQVVSSD